MLTVLVKDIIIMMIDYEVMARIQADIINLYRENYPEFFSISQETVKKIMFVLKRTLYF